MIPLNTVVQGDCRAILRQLPSNSIDFVLTDPPYFVSYCDRLGRTLANDRSETEILSAFTDVYRVMKPGTFCFSFYGWSRVDAFVSAWRRSGLRMVGHVVWCKRYASKVGFLRNQHEQAYLLVKGEPVTPAAPLSDVREWEYSGNEHHPTEKAVSILQPLIKTYCPPEGIVVDPFVGSGSSLVAAALTGRRYLGIDVDANHVRTSKNRLAQLPNVRRADTNVVSPAARASGGRPSALKLDSRRPESRPIRFGSASDLSARHRAAP